MLRRYVDVTIVAPFFALRSRELLEIYRFVRYSLITIFEAAKTDAYGNVVRITVSRDPNTIHFIANDQNRKTRGIDEKFTNGINRRKFVLCASLFTLQLIPNNQRR